MIKRSVNIAGHATSISLEPEFWNALKDLTKRRGVSVNTLIAEIDESRSTANLSSAIRITILQDLQKRCTN